MLLLDKIGKTNSSVIDFFFLVKIMISSYFEAKDIEGINVAIDITNTLIIMPSNLKDEQGHMK